MKLKKLTIRNLASIADATIDFDAEPLKSAPLFLLCGETGAGKTTILDAICLALFGQTPRYEEIRVKNAAEVGALAFNDPRQLVRRGAGGASVTLTLLGNDGQDYEASWSVESITRKVRNQGRLKGEVWQWKNVSKNTATHLKSECHDCVRAAVGLDFVQFTRTTMLAQGQFTKFLLCDDAEKASILEKLTDTSRFSALGQRIASVYREKSELVKGLTKEIEGLSGLGEKRAERERELAAAKGAVREKEAAVGLAQARLNWEIRRLEKEKALQTAKRSLADARAAVETEEFHRKAADVADWDLSQGVHAAVREIAQATARLANVEHDLADYRAGVADMRGQIAFARDERIRMQEDVAQLERKLIAEMPKAAVYEASSVIAHDLRDAWTFGQEALKKAEAARRGEESLPGLREKTSVAEANLKRVKDDAAAKEEVIRSAERDLEAMDLVSARKRLEVQTGRQGDLNKLSLLIKAMNVAAQQAETVCQRLADNQTKLKRATESLPTVQQAAEDAKVARDEARARYDHTKELIDAGIEKIVLGLHEGDECPVCKRRIETLAAASSFAPLLEDQRSSAVKAQVAYDECQNALNALNARVEELQRSVKDAETDVARWDEKRADAESDIRVAADAIGLTDLSEASLTAAIGETEGRIRTLNETLQSGDGKNRQIAVLRSELKGLQDEVEERRNGRDELANKVKESENAVKQLRREGDLANGSRTAKMSSVDEQLADVLPTWRADWERDGEAFVGKLLDSARDYRTKTDRLKSLADEIRRRVEDDQKLAKALDDVWGLMPDWRGDEPGARVRGDDLFGRATRLSADIRHQRDERDGARRRLAENERIRDDFLLAHEGWSRARLEHLLGVDIGTLREQVDAGKRKVEQLGGACSQAGRAFEEHLAARPEGLDESATKESLEAALSRSQGELNELNSAIGGIERDLKADDECGMRRREKEVEKARAQDEAQEWEPLDKAFGDADGKKIRLVIQSYVLSNVLDQANRYLRQLSDRYELACVGLTLTVKDAYEGGAERPAKTLSGGEGFLVSLALALGLAAMNDTGLSVEMLFIDEGFGTLSGEHLNVAIEALERLNALTGSRKVGVISHVERLRERIATHVEVVRRGHDPSRVIVTDGHRAAVA